MKHILLPTDFSDAACNAMEYAAQLFKNEACTFYVLNTFTPVALYTTTIYQSHSALNIDLGALYKKKSEENVQKAIDQISTKYPDKKHHYMALSSYNVLPLEVEELSLRYPLDCIVMGTNGASGLKEVFIGSQTMHVIKGAKIPVIGVPVNFKYKNPKEILFATDYETDTKQKGLYLLKELCTKHIARLIFLNAYYGITLDEKQLDNKVALDTYFKKNAHLTEIADGLDVLEAIDDFQNRHHIDLLVLVHNKHNFFENLLFTPVVHKVVHHSNVPFFILPPFKN
jgi:nucleotide-binding universal stress UspA family protein